MRLGIMCSGNGTNFENIVTNPICNKHEVVLMIHNTKECGAVARAAKFGIPHIRVPHKDEDKMIELFKAWRVDLIVLAGYMRVIKNPDAFPAPMINIHPSLLPKYKGLNAIEQALDSGDSVTGCTVHYVTEELDGGTIIKQQEVPILPDDTLESLTKAIQRIEYGLLPSVINSWQSTTI
jgi:phosphoribosylglycinamide formyltransferase-1|tara:strand:+ start:73 stop:609 length:537 start_codon:yes stop_codon:yes gene_type:complete